MILFALAGPIFGTTAIVGAASLTVLGSGGGVGPSLAPAIAGFLLFAVIALGVGLALGVVPATITGVICLALSRHVRSTAPWLWLSALVGGSVTAIFAVVVRALILTGAGPAHSVAPMAALMMPVGMAVTGAVAALACAALSRKWRPFRP